MDENQIHADQNIEPAQQNIDAINYFSEEGASAPEIVGTSAPEKGANEMAGNNTPEMADRAPETEGNSAPEIEVNKAYTGNNGAYSADSSAPAGGAPFASRQRTDADQSFNFPRNPAYYTENYKKQKSRKTSLLQMLCVAVLSAILGGGVVAAAFLFVAPLVQPAIGSYLGTNVPATGAVATNNGAYKKVEITQSASPITAIAEKVSPSIVGIKVTIASQDQGFFSLGQPNVGEGSGIVIKEDGYILTNNHVVEQALAGNTNKLSPGSKIEVILPSQKDKPYSATVVGRDTKSDIAVIKIDAKGLPAAELGNSDELKTGELAVAIGNPAGIDYMGSVTSGIISGLNRTIQMENGEQLTLIQTDAAINPGNSGGALLNSQGQVIGVNTVKIAETGYEGLGFAIPINHAKSIAQSLIDYKYVKGRPYIGVSIDQSFTPDVAKQYNVPTGLLVYDVTPLSAGYKAGIMRGDIITKFDGQPVKAFSELESLKNKHKPGDQVNVEIFRDNAYKTLKLTLDEDKNQ